MDFRLIYSNFSPSCRELFQTIPGLQEKAICADHADLRAMLGNIGVIGVPTLLVVDGERILQRITGADSIQNWFFMLNNFNMDPPEQKSFEPEQIVIESPPENPIQSHRSVKSTAEELQREREQMFKEIGIS